MDIIGGVIGILLGVVVVGAYGLGYARGYREALEWATMRIRETFK